MLNRHSREDEKPNNTSPDSLITNHIDIWTTAIERKSSAGRGTSNKFSLYGIKKLRELILELAVRGKLVPQDENDEPASVLLKRIAAEKAQLVKEGKLKKPKPLPEISDEEEPFYLPSGWEWSRLGDFVSIIRGITFPSSEKHRELAPSRVACIRTTNVQDSLEWDDLLYVDRSYVKREEQYLKLGDIVMSMANSRELVGKVSFITHIPVGESSFGGFLSVIRPYQFDARFLMSVLRAPLTKNELIGSASQTTNIANISLEKLNPLVIAVPPLEEQHRIVAKVEELMGLCDALEAQTEASISAHQTLVETLLNALLQPSITQQKDSQSASPESSFADSLEPALNNSFIDSWQRIAEHFDTLFTTAASIDTLKQTILQLAVMGKLVEQDDNDEPAVELIKKNKYGMSEDIVKCGSLPSGWIWTALGNFANCERGRFSIRPRNDPLCYDGDHPFIQIGDLPKFGGVIDCHKQTLNEKGLTVSKKFPENTIVIAIVGATIGNTGMLGYDMCFPDSMVGINTGTRIGNNYLELYLRSLKNKVRNVAYAGGGQPNIKLQILNPLPILVPPSAEQQRIVAKVDELMALCDQLKARLRDAQTTQLHLTDAIVEQAV
ncbi:restriction endonuclease subunit S [Shewanella vesiculosa]